MSPISLTVVIKLISVYNLSWENVSAVRYDNNKHDIRSITSSITFSLFAVVAARDEVLNDGEKQNSNFTRTLITNT
jgi:hypothetical protein